MSQEVKDQELSEAEDMSNPTATAIEVGVGHALRKVRRQKKVALEDISKALKIRVRYLEAIENESLGDLPSHVYGVAFVRSYARFLGLDEEKILNQYHAQIDQSLPVQGYDFPEPLTTRATPGFKSFLLGGLLILGSLSLWAYMKKPIFTPAIDSSKEIKSEEKKTSDPLEGTDNSPSAHVTERSVLSHDSEVSNSQKEESDTETLPELKTHDSDSVNKGIEGSHPSQEEGTQSGVLLRATERVWVQIRNIRGVPVFTKTMNAGEEQLLTDPDELSITVGNAGGIEIVHNGVLLPSLGNKGEVKRNISLNPKPAS